MYYISFPGSTQYCFIYIGLILTYRIQYLIKNRFMSYFYEVNSNANYEKTKKEIQQSIFNLEEKLRRRKQLQLELLREEEAISRYRPYPYVYGSQPINSTNPLRLYQQPLLPSRNRNYPTSQLQVEHLNQDYLQKLDKIERQKLLIQRQMKIDNIMKFNKPAGIYPHDVNLYSDHNNISDDMLVAQYNDGSKLQQYQNELQVMKRNPRSQAYQQPTIPARNHAINEVKKMQANTTDQNFRTAPKKKLQPEFEENLRTPYQLLLSNQNASASKPKQSVQFNSKSEKPYIINQYPQYLQQSKEQNKYIVGSDRGLLNDSRPNHNYIQYLQRQKDTLYAKNSEKYTKSMNKLGRTGQNNIGLKADCKEQGFTQRSASPIINRSPNNKLKRRVMSSNKISPHKLSINRYPNNSKLQRSHYANLQTSALKKIENRLKLSQIVYNDSQYKNLKYQLNHLLNIYENEVKARKQIRDKINNFPPVLKRHGMVVQ